MQKRTLFRVDKPTTYCEPSFMWSTWHIAAINEYPPQPGDQPNLRAQGNPEGGGTQNFVDDYLAGLGVAAVSCAFQAASDFMNLCEDLKNLATLIDGGAA